jgi:hypothetical protein
MQYRELLKQKADCLASDSRSLEVASRRSPEPPLRSIGGGGDCGGRVLVHARRRYARVSGRLRERQRARLGSK